MAEDKRDVQISKSLAYLLRHGAVKEGLPIDNNGYVAVDILLQHNRLKSLHCKMSDIDRVVANNAKKRFHIQSVNGQALICATQGHSLKSVSPSDEVLQKISSQEQLPSKLVHGTNFNSLHLILQSECIKKMRRNHIHLASGITGLDDGVVSGMRLSSNVYIYLNVEDLHSKIKLFKSLNDVYLTPDDIPIDLVRQVVLVDSDKNGPAIQELEPILENRKINYRRIKRGEAHFES
ncbi:LAME_0F06370g1_1 [Lachancea meyersii CBS 8951]|uniref:2'-phosphotransferase n=1 Tax=Lachancea meyersii CBS 8951 TaxID=1266667 RepID=A0A1G4JTE1_9SACH|nr:LAME_0F06370g1_1 [Lachancea meyersii CBS 8951]